jgi:hypothetical protein
MLSGVMLRASEMAGTAVLRMVVSSDSMKKATATSHGSKRKAASEGTGASAAVLEVGDELMNLRSMEKSCA